MNERMGGWLDGWMDGWMDGWLDDWMGKQMDEWHSGPKQNRFYFR